MNWKALKTEEDYNKASLRLMEIFDVEPNAPEFDELDLLIILIKDYDDRHYSVPERDDLETPEIIIGYTTKGIPLTVSEYKEILQPRINDVRNGTAETYTSEQVLNNILKR